VNHVGVPLEVVGPDIGSGVEKWHHDSGGRLNRGEVGAFVTIAKVTSKRQVLRCGHSAMLATDNMVYVKSEERFLLLGQAAVFASATGPIFNRPTEFGRNPVHVRG